MVTGAQTGLGILLWSGLTILIYAAARAFHLRRPAWWSHPVLLAFLVLIALLAAGRVPYAAYRAGTAPLVWLLSPSVVAFAVPIYDQRKLILHRWPILLAAVACGSTISVLLSWELARALMLAPQLRASLLPRSVSAPFAMLVAARLGGVPGLAATFTAITGLIGATLAGPWARLLRIGSKFARGTMLGMGAHGLGTARAFEWGAEEGAAAAVTMTLAGVANVLAAIVWGAIR